jgi:hypothetical protein
LYAKTWGITAKQFEEQLETDKQTVLKKVKTYKELRSLMEVWHNHCAKLSVSEIQTSRAKIGGS